MTAINDRLPAAPDARAHRKYQGNAGSGRELQHRPIALAGGARRGSTTINDLLERLRALHWRVTPQRRAVAEVLSGEHVHLTAEAIHGRAQILLPEISLATVYNTLNELVAMGEVLEIAAGSGPKRYDPNVAVRHHHLVCRSCGMLRDVFPSGETRLELSPEDRHGFELSGVDIVFQGTCPECLTCRLDGRDEFSSTQISRALTANA